MTDMYCHLYLSIDSLPAEAVEFAQMLNEAMTRLKPFTRDAMGGGKPSDLEPVGHIAWQMLQENNCLVSEAVFEVFQYTRLTIKGSTVNPNIVSLILQKTLQEFELPDIIEVMYSCSADRFTIGAFFGGFRLVSAERIEHFDFRKWFDDRTAEINEARSKEFPADGGPVKLPKVTLVTRLKANYRVHFSNDTGRAGWYWWRDHNPQVGVFDTIENAAIDAVNTLTRLGIITGSMRDDMLK